MKVVLKHDAEDTLPLHTLRKGVCFQYSKETTIWMICFAISVDMSEYLKKGWPDYLPIVDISNGGITLLHKNQLVTPVMVDAIQK